MLCYNHISIYFYATTTGRLLPKPTESSFGTTCLVLILIYNFHFQVFDLVAEAAKFKHQVGLCAHVVYNRWTKFVVFDELIII